MRRFDRASATTLRLLAPALLLCGAALAVPVMQLIIGVRLEGYKAAYDGSFAVAVFSQYYNEVAHGHWLPRWVTTGHGGLGSPMFFFYPPGSFAAATILQFSLPGLSAATIIGLMCVLFRAASIVTCALWLRLRTGTGAALTGAALYTLMPYMAVLDPQIRLAYAECASAVLVPVAFLAVDLGIRNRHLMIPLVALAMALLAVIHLPMTVLMGSLLGIYSLVCLDDWRSPTLRVFRVFAGILLGLGLAGFTIIPALALLPAITQQALWDPGHQPQNNVLFDVTSLHPSFFSLFEDLSALVPLILALFAVRGRGHFRTAQPRGLTHHARGGLSCFTTLIPGLDGAVSAALCAISSRLNLPISLLGTALVAYRFSGFPPLWRRAAYGVGFTLAIAWIGLAIARGDGMRSGDVRTREALLSPGANASEYMPATATARGWFHFGQDGGNYLERAATMVSPCVRQQTAAAIYLDVSGELVFDVHDCNGSAVLPQFYFPGWSATLDGSNLAVANDQGTGLISVEVAKDSNTIMLQRTMLRVEKLGILISIGSILIWLTAVGIRALQAQLIPNATFKRLALILVVIRTLLPEPETKVGPTMAKGIAG